MSGIGPNDRKPKGFGQIAQRESTLRDLEYLKI